MALEDPMWHQSLDVRLRLTTIYRDQYLRMFSVAACRIVGSGHIFYDGTHINLDM